MHKFNKDDRVLTAPMRSRIVKELVDSAAKIKALQPGDRYLVRAIIDRRSDRIRRIELVHDPAFAQAPRWPPEGAKPGYAETRPPAYYIDWGIYYIDWGMLGLPLNVVDPAPERQHDRLE